MELERGVCFSLASSYCVVGVARELTPLTYFFVFVATVHRPTDDSPVISALAESLGSLVTTLTRRRASEIGDGTGTRGIALVADS